MKKSNRTYKEPVGLFNIYSGTHRTDTYSTKQARKQASKQTNKQDLYSLANSRVELGT